MLVPWLSSNQNRKSFSKAAATFLHSNPNGVTTLTLPLYTTAQRHLQVYQTNLALGRIRCSLKTKGLGLLGGMAVSIVSALWGSTMDRCLALSPGSAKRFPAPHSHFDNPVKFSMINGSCCWKMDKLYVMSIFRFMQILDIMSYDCKG